ncbi:hypothetical protein BDV95DRAFT_563221 [Massariosphaeria phaeospora]|uniref:Uncharacterized protein n=1 Tax=Massariosphaeria phaeospora TaxID=100035 RepID=A0A7C8MB81_9PLEO|nr:hypothetical protein BDV95DRAFT_563221 [Massariosphaeria phaeospora]
MVLRVTLFLSSSSYSFVPAHPFTVTNGAPSNVSYLLPAGIPSTATNGAPRNFSSSSLVSFLPSTVTNGAPGNASSSFLSFPSSQHIPGRYQWC